ADTAADDGGVDVRSVNVLSEQTNFTRQAGASNQLVHAIERAQQSGFAATTRADDGGDSSGLDLRGHVEERLVLAEPAGNRLDVERDLRRLNPLFRFDGRDRRAGFCRWRGFLN